MTAIQQSVQHEIRPATACDLARIVDIHVESFPTFFLTSLGPRFLHCLYEEILADPAGIELVYKQEAVVAGFVAGTTEPRGFYRRLLTGRWHRFGLASVGPLLKNPLIAPRLLNAFRKSKEEPGGRRCGLLMSIAVDPLTQAHGIGSALVMAFLEESRKRGLEAVHLTTDSHKNDRANRFYEKLGFTVSNTIVTAQGRVMNDYEIHIGGSIAPPGLPIYADSHDAIFKT